jgi:hypothetical protein
LKCIHEIKINPVIYSSKNILVLQYYVTGSLATDETVISAEHRLKHNNNTAHQRHGDDVNSARNALISSKRKLNETTATTNPLF